MVSNSQSIFYNIANLSLLTLTLTIPKMTCMIGLDFVWFAWILSEGPGPQPH
jgi:hypothetical protein